MSHLKCNNTSKLKLKRYVMGYTPPANSIQKYGVEIERLSLTNETISVVALGANTLGDITTNTQFYENHFSLPSGKVGAYFVSSNVITDTARINNYLALAKTKATQKLMADITGTGADYTAIVLAPDTLSYKEKCLWYEQHIISAVKNITDLAIQLGEDPEKVEKALVYVSQSITQIATVINPVAGAIAGAVSGVISLLDAFDVFSGSAKAEYLKAKEQYNISNFVLTRWYEEYAICIKRFHEIDEIEFNNYVAKLKSSTATTTTNTATNTSVFSSLQSFVSDNTWLTAIIILLVLLVVYQYRKNKKGTKK